MERVRKLIRKRKNILFTFCIIILVGIATTYAAVRVTILEENNCYDALFQLGEQLNQDIERLISYDNEQLQAFAGIFSEYDDLESDSVIDIIHHYQQCGMVSRLEILLPDDTLLLQDGRKVPAGKSMRFATEAAQGAHISKIQAGSIDPDSRVLRNMVPIIKDGETIGILHGVVDLDRLQDVWNLNIYGVKADIYIVERSSGYYIVDTYHDELSNVVAKIDDDAVIQGSNTKTGIARQMMQGKTGYAIFNMPDNEENIYFCYMPCKINNWELAISVPESVVLQNVREIRNVLYMLVCFELVCFLTYVIWMFRDSRRQNAKKQEQIDLMTFTSDVQELLFEAHLNQENIEQALRLIGEMTGAQYAFFKIMSENGHEQIYQWLENNPDRVTMRIPQENVHFFSNHFNFKNGKGSIYLPDIELLHDEEWASYDLLKKEGIHSLMAVAVHDVSGSLVGALGVCNMDEKWKNTQILDATKISFAMLYHNMRSYEIIREMGTVDMLTGLLNRNCYQNNLKGYPELDYKTLDCMYCDVNGLHELNNTKGHDAGDEMLKAVAYAIKSYFGGQHSYRIGGDEFVAFALDAQPQDVAKWSQEIAAALEKQGYFVSLGTCRGCPEQAEQIEEMVKNAETQMYAAKRSFYERAGRDRRHR